MRKKIVLIKIASREWKSNIKVFKNRKHQLESTLRPCLENKEQSSKKEKTNFIKLPQWS